MNATDEYLKILGLDQCDASDREDKVRWLALQRAHDIRKFEIDLYWKRATYFFILQAAVLAGVGFALPGPRSSGEPTFALLLGCVGLLTALAGRLSAIGSRFWQRNWERHIDFLESEFEGSLYKAVWIDAHRTSWSVTRVNQVLMLVFVCMWHAVIFGSLGWGIVQAHRAGIELACADLDSVATMRLIASTGIVLATAALWREMEAQKTQVDGDDHTVSGETRWLRVRAPAPKEKATTPPA